MTQPSILTIVVTYNREVLLKRCVEALKHQTYSSNTILIINNSSTDNTENYLKENSIPFITQPNGGSSAGWHSGLKKAIEGNYDYVWMMDDDGYPHKDALQILISNMQPNIVALSSLVVNEKNHDELVFGLPILNKKGNPVLFSLKRKCYTRQELMPFGDSFPSIHPFNGTLINVEKAKKIGNIDLSYYMSGDEVDYYFRMRKEGNLKTIFNALHFHPSVAQRNIDEKRVFYYIRNTIILNHLYFDIPYTRDLFTIGVAMFRILKRNGVKVFLSYLFGSNTKYFYPSIIDGYKNKKNNIY